MNKNHLIKGTVILTVTGLITRLLGFFYRICLSNALTAEQLGIYQLIFPVYGICFTIYASGIQTAISQMTAAEAARDGAGHPKHILKAGISLSLGAALLLSALVWRFHGFIADKHLLEPECSESLKLLSCVFPFCGITACINGYFYGKKRAAVPALSQLFEQIIRIGSVFALASIFGGGSLSVTCELAVTGLVIGEAASCLFNLISLLLSGRHMRASSASDSRTAAQTGGCYRRRLLGFSVPLTVNRLLINVLHSLEAVMIPGLLRRYGLSSANALAIYGELNGMVLPFQMFPGTITNSLSVLLLPEISEAQAADKKESIQSAVSLSLKYSLIVGIFSACVFLVFGNTLGNTVFGNETAGSFLKAAAWLCPMMYLATTLGSIINGLGKVHITFLNSVIGQTLRIGILFLLIPRFGISGYFIGMLTSQLIITLLDYCYVLRSTGFLFDIPNSLLKPAAAALFTCPLFFRLYEFFVQAHPSLKTLLLPGCCILLCVVYLLLLVITKAIKKEEIIRS